MRQQLMAAAVGVDLPYELLTRRHGDISDRTLRVLLNEFRRRIEQVQFSVYVYQLCRPVRAWWLDTAYLSGQSTCRTIRRGDGNSCARVGSRRGWATSIRCKTSRELLEIGGGSPAGASMRARTDAK